MTTDMAIWRNLVDNEVRSVADEKFQREVWFGGGGGRWVDSPTEQFCRFFDNARVPEFLDQADNGLNEKQASCLARLTELMNYLADHTPDVIRPEDLIDDPRWVEIRRQAAVTFEALSKES